MARISFKLPDIGEGIAEAEIVAWHVAVGDMIEEDRPLADMMTDKATVEMSAPVSGRVVEIAGVVGDRIAIGAVLAVFDDGADAGEAASIESTAGSSGLPDEHDTRPVRAVSSEVEMHPARTDPPKHPDGLEPGGAKANDKPARVLASPAVRARAKDLGVDLATVRPAHGDRVRHADLDAFLRYAAPNTPPIATDRTSPVSGEDVEEVRVTGLRRRIAENMAESKRSIPHFA